MIIFFFIVIAVLLAFQYAEFCRLKNYTSFKSFMYLIPGFFYLYWILKGTGWLFLHGIELFFEILSEIDL